MAIKFDHVGCDDYREVSRRAVLRSAVSAGVSAFGLATALSQISVREDKAATKPNVLVVLFLRGGADGLNIVAPYGEDAYHRLRPTLALSKGDLLDLDGFFGLHPSLAPLLPMFHEGRVGIVHAVGSGDESRSHFEAMNAMERGVEDANSSIANGWLARYLKLENRSSSSPLRAVAFSSVMPDSLRGATRAVALSSLTEYRLEQPDDRSSRYQELLANLYAGGNDKVSRAARATLAVLKVLRENDPRHYRPDYGASYPESDLGAAFRQTAFLIKQDVGMEIAVLERGGWDTHVAQGSTSGWLASQLEDVGSSMAAFAADMGRDLDRVTVIVMTEFGRRAYENTGLGTDHGRASVMLAMGGGVAGGKVGGVWPGLDDDRLEGPGDLRVTTDYRSVLAEALRHRMHFKGNEELFAGLANKTVGLFQP